MRPLSNDGPLLFDTGSDGAGARTQCDFGTSSDGLACSEFVNGLRQSALFRFIILSEISEGNVASPLFDQKEHKHQEFGSKVF